MKKKCLLFLVLLFSFIGFSASHPIQAEAKTEVMYVAVSEEKGFPVVNKEPTEDKDEIYNRYEENSFSLMNKEFSSLNKINEFRQNLDSMIKNWVWSAASAIGRFNARMVKGLFSLDLATQVKEPFQELSLDLANSLVNVATTFGLVMVALFMVIKYATTGQFFEAVKIFGLAILTMISFAIFTDPKGNEFFFDGVISIDHQLEKALAGVNPNFKPEGQTHFVPGNGEEDDNDLANRLAAEVFYNNVYVPYLYMQYGTADEAEIREQAIEYNGQSFDRIGALLDNDSASEAQVAFVEDVTDYEVDELGNTNPIYTNAFRWTGLAFLYVITNGLQFFIYGLLGIVRIAFQFLLVAIPVFFPIALIFAMVIQGKDVLGSYFKGLGTIMFIKGGISLLMVIFMSYVTLAYSVMNTQTTDPLDRVITFIAWILAPPFLWTFRRFLGIIFTPGPYASKLSRMGMALRHPIQANRQAKAEQAAQKATRQQQREDAKARYKKKQAAAEKNGASSHGLNEVNKKNKPENALRAERNKAAEANKKAESTDKEKDANGQDLNKPTDKDKQDLRAQRAARKEVDPKASEQPGSEDNELNKTNGQSGPVSDRRQNRQQSTDSPQKSTPTLDEASSQDLNKPRQGQEESEKRTKRKEQSTGSGEVQGREKQSERSSSKEAAVGSKVAKTGKQTPAQQRQERSEPTQSTSDVGAKTKSVGTSTRQVDRKTGEPTSNQGSNSKHTKGQTVRNPAQAPKKERGKSAKKQATSNEQKHAGADKYLKKDNQTVRQPVRRK
ncbi:hypothetical protein [Enterococcus sp. DIV0213h]|uniref:hypothetical protein n=1 Tax=Enterococcus sp. DIV0213h TaxID=2774669 RepID=UPI003F29523D